jgi:hypothetical protein
MPLSWQLSLAWPLEQLGEAIDDLAGLVHLLEKAVEDGPANHGAPLIGDSLINTVESGIENEGGLGSKAPMSWPSPDRGGYVVLG